MPGVCSRSDRVVWRILSGSVHGKMKRTEELIREAGSIDERSFESCAVRGGRCGTVRLVRKLGQNDQDWNP